MHFRSTDYQIGRGDYGLNIGCDSCGVVVTDTAHSREPSLGRGDRRRRYRPSSQPILNVVAARKGRSRVGVKIRLSHILGSSRLTQDCPTGVLVIYAPREEHSLPSRSPCAKGQREISMIA